MSVMMSLVVQKRVLYGFASSVLLSLVLTAPVSALTIAEVLKNPSAFDQQTINVTGEAAHVVTRYGDAPSTTFDILDAKGTSLSILVSGVPSCKQGEVCRVSGLFVAQKNLILPQKIEKISEGEYKDAGVLFRKRKGGKSGGTSGGSSLRGVYIPQ